MFYLKEKTVQLMKNSALIDLTLNSNTDSSRHYMTFFTLVLSLKAKTVLELGVRDGGSTIPFLMGLSYTNGHLTSVDINDNLILRNKLQEYKHWNFIVSDAISFLQNDNKIYDIIFIDDWHDGDHVLQELNLVKNKINENSLILMHDTMCWNTEPNYHYYLDKEGEFANGGPWSALKQLDKNIWEYVTIPVSNGLTIIRKIGKELIY